MNVESRLAYSEVVEILSKMEPQYSEKIPIKLREYFTYNKLPNYTEHINMELPLKKQNLSRKTINILTLLNLKYWTKTQKHKEELMKRYQENEEKYSPNNMFKNRNKVIENVDKTDNPESVILPAELKTDSFITKIINVIKRNLKKIFRRPV